MEDEKIDKEEVWSAIRYLDPHEREKDKEVNMRLPPGVRQPVKTLFAVR
jgi:hypothetical protein